MSSVLCWDCNMIIILFTVQKCGPRKSAECAQWGELHCCTTDFYCRDHFLPTDFMTPEGIHLNRLAVPLDLDSASHSILQSSPPLLPTLSRQLCICKYLICVMYLCIHGLLEKYPTFGREKETGLLGALDT